MARELSPAAQVAKLIRQYLRAEGIQASVTSDNYSMGNSVNAYLVDQPPAVMAKIKEATAQYQYGEFNGMEDIYEMSNVNNNIPQTKYLFINNKLSDELRQAIWDFARGYFSPLENAPAVWADVGYFPIPNWNLNASELVYRLFSGAEPAYWNYVADKAAAAEVVQS
jgi:hypothetical protein